MYHNTVCLKLLCKSVLFGQSQFFMCQFLSNFCTDKLTNFTTNTKSSVVLRLMVHNLSYVISDMVSEFIMHINQMISATFIRVIWQCELICCKNGKMKRPSEKQIIVTHLKSGMSTLQISKMLKRNH